MAGRRIKSRPGLFGEVYYYDENGKPIGKSRPGLMDGTRVYMDQNGRYAGKSRPGVLAKEVFTDTQSNHITSYDSLSGEVYYKNGKPGGNSHPGFFGSAHTVLEEENACCEEMLENAYDEEDTEEICADTEDETYSPQEIQHTVVRNLQHFFLCIAICIVIAAIYAIIKFN